MEVYRVVLPWETSDNKTDQGKAYTKSKGENYPNNALSVVTTSESYYAIGYDGKSGIPIFNWSLIINNLNIHPCNSSDSETRTQATS